MGRLDYDEPLLFRNLSEPAIEAIGPVENYLVLHGPQSDD
jgi:hypothetical protein